MDHVGVDGCGAGWIAVTKDQDELTYRLFSNAAELVTAFAQAERILIDIPIGLPWSAAPIRPCDDLARMVLSARRSSVFPVPCRAAAHAKNVDEARRLNKAVLGRSLSEQTWGICRKIAEVDKLLGSRPATGGEIREIHPEICFWGLAGRSPMRNKKKDEAGVAERLALLSTLEPTTGRLLNHVLAKERRKDVTADDVLDAIVAFVTSRTPKSRLRSLRGTPANDETGLPMEMLYVEP